MTAVVIILMIVWLIIIQVKLAEVSESIKEIKQTFLKDKIYEKHTEQTSGNQEPAKKTEEPLSISDIPDEVIFNKKADKLPKYIENNLKEEKPSKDFENIFLGNIFNKIGAIALLIGLIILIKLVSPYFVFTPQLKITLGYLAGILMMIGALKLHQKENMKNYSEVLLGTGFGAMFISTYCASALFELFGFAATAIIATALLLAAFYLADKLKTVSMLVISLIAAYMNPIFLNSEFDIPSNFLFGYLIFINLLSLVYTYRNKSRSITNTVNLCITFFAALTLCYEIPFAGIVTLWAIYVVYDVITGSGENKNKVVNYINLAVLTGLLLDSFWGEHRLIGYTQLGCAVIYAVISYFKKSDSEMFKNYLHMSLIAAFLFVYFICNESPATKCLVWSIEAVILAYFASKYKLKMLAGWTCGIWAAAYCSILTIDGVLAVKSIAKYVPVWNIRLAMFLPIIISSSAAFWLLNKTEDEKLVSIGEFFRFACISSVYLYIGLELNNIITQRFIGVNTNSGFINNMLNAIIFSAYAINIKRLHMIAKSMTGLLLPISAIAGICALIFLIFTGVHYKPIDAFIPVINIRFIAFLSGIAASILYAKWTDNKVFKYIAIILGFILLHYETVDMITKYSITDGSYLISVGWVLYSGIVTTIGILKNKDFLKISGIGLCILSILRIFIFDLSKVDILYKFIAILTLGIILMILSYLYNKKSAK